MGSRVVIPNGVRNLELGLITEKEAFPTNDDTRTTIDESPNLDLQIYEIQPTSCKMLG